jgi:Flp pilus assembly protein CpaB
MKDENWGVVVVLVLALGVALVGGYDLARKSGGGEATATAAPTATAVKEETPAVVVVQAPLPAGVEVTAGEVVTYTYRMDERGERVWSEAGRIPTGRLIKAQGCVGGYRQVEYQPDLGRPGFWKVEWERCAK